MLFADVVHSMDIAAAVGAERWREIMADLADRCAAVVQRYGSTVAQWIGDGIMAVFGAPVALEDHAVRACLAALGVQEASEAACCRCRRARRYRAAVAGRAELRGGDRRWDWFGPVWLRRRGRAGRHGAADGVGGPAGWGDAQRVDGATG